MTENKFDTLRIHAGYDPKDHRFASSVPIYQTAAFGLENTAMADKIVTGKLAGRYDYSRDGNPTVRVFEERIAALDGGIDAVAVGSGMAAISYTILNVAENGGRIIAPRNIYGSSLDEFRTFFPKFGINFDFVDDINDFQAVQRAGMKFAYLKTTSGTTYFDDDFAANYDRIQGADLKVGVYMMFSFNKSAKEQAKYFIKMVGHKVGNLPIAIQVQYYGNYEDNPPNSAKQGKQLRELTNELANYYTAPCIIWTTPTIANKMITPYLSDSRQWLIVDGASELNKLKITKQTEFVQYSDAADLTVSGQKIKFVTSVFTGKKQTWQEVE